MFYDDEVSISIKDDNLICLGEDLSGFFLDGLVEWC